jgi:hypothetical protein
MTPLEFYLIADAKRPPEMIGNLRKDVYDDLAAALETNSGEPRKT